MSKPVKTWKEKCIEWKEQGDGLDSDALDVEDKMCVNINMVFQLPVEFGIPESEVAQFVLGTERAIFEKPGELGKNMKPLYIKGHLDGTPVDRMLVDGGACINIMSLVVFEKLGHREGELMKTNMTLSGFSGEASEAKGIIMK
jgi:hypothetical protein